MVVEGDGTINFLLIGETGVGKSTFINSFANYILNKNFEEALKRPPQLPIPTIITVYDENQKDVTICVGKDKSEKQEVGASATQRLKTYLFPIEGQEKMIQLIDTPGVGDTEGISKDDENWDEILSFLAQLQYIHGVCFLMKPSNDRETVLFSYVMRRILSQLHKSAADNIVFIFTNTKGTNYRPGTTTPLLKKTRDAIKRGPPYVEVPINKDNIFCLDNESLLYLIAVHEGVKVNENALRSCSISWTQACKEIVRLIDYVTTIHPHNVKDTVSVNKTRDLVLQMAKPMADILQLVEENIKDLTAKEKNSERTGQTVEELRQKLYKPGVDLEVKKLDKPIVVCTNCAESIQVGDTSKVRYTQKCHDPCLTGTVAYEIVGHWSLRWCSEMNWDLKCKHCGCSYEKHMTIFYDTDVVPKQYLDKEVDFNLKSEEMQLERLGEVIEEMKARKIEMEQELKILRECAAKFACYLENNAITSSYDAFKGYITLALESEKRRGKDANPEVINTLTFTLGEHEKLIEAFKSHKRSFIDSHITENTIQEDIDRLKTLKYAGPKIVEILEVRAACYKKVSIYRFKSVFTQYVPKCFLKE